MDPLSVSPRAAFAVRAWCQLGRLALCSFSLFSIMGKSAVIWCWSMAWQMLCTGYLSDACLLVLLRYLAFGGLCQQALSLGVCCGEGMGENGTWGLKTLELQLVMKGVASIQRIFTWPPNYRGGLESCLPLVKTWLSYWQNGLHNSLFKGFRKM